MLQDRKGLLKTNIKRAGTDRSQRHSQHPVLEMHANWLVLLEIGRQETTSTSVN